MWKWIIWWQKRTKINSTYLSNHFQLAVITRRIKWIPIYPSKKQIYVRCFLYYCKLSDNEQSNWCKKVTPWKQKTFQAYRPPYRYPNSINFLQHHKLKVWTNYRMVLTIMQYSFQCAHQSVPQSLSMCFLFIRTYSCVSLHDEPIAFKARR